MRHGGRLVNKFISINKKQRKYLSLLAYLCPEKLKLLSLLIYEYVAARLPNLVHTYLFRLQLNKYLMGSHTSLELKGNYICKL